MSTGRGKMSTGRNYMSTERRQMSTERDYMFTGRDYMSTGRRHMFPGRNFLVKLFFMETEDGVCECVIFIPGRIGPVHYCCDKSQVFFQKFLENSNQPLEISRKKGIIS
jgi:hypothetical protein